MYYGYYETGGELARREAGHFLGCDYEETFLMPSTTLSMNLLGDGLVASGYLKQGDRVLTTDQEPIP